MSSSERPILSFDDVMYPHILKKVVELFETATANAELLAKVLETATFLLERPVFSTQEVMVVIEGKQDKYQLLMLGLESLWRQWFKK